jgi:hypothetical protein
MLWGQSGRPFSGRRAGVRRIYGDNGPVFSAAERFSGPITREAPDTISILRLGSVIQRHNFNPDRRHAVMGNIIIRGGLAKGGREKSSPKKGARTSEIQQALLRKSDGLY